MTTSGDQKFATVKPVEAALSMQASCNIRKLVTQTQANHGTTLALVPIGA